MLRTVLWIAGACVAVLVALAVSRSLNLGGPPAVSEPPPAVEAQVVTPEPAAAPAPPPTEATPAPTPEEIQIQDDAAATGMTTMEPETAPAEGPPTN